MHSNIETNGTETFPFHGPPNGISFLPGTTVANPDTKTQKMQRKIYKSNVFLTFIYYSITTVQMESIHIAGHI